MNQVQALAYLLALCLTGCGSLEDGGISRIANSAAPDVIGSPAADDLVGDNNSPPGNVILNVDTQAPTTTSLPRQPVYNGKTYYVSPSGSGISTDRSKPGSPKLTAEGVDDFSVVVFLPGTYPSLSISKPKQTGQIKLISQILALDGIDTRKRTQLSYSTIAGQIVKNPRTSGAAIKGSLTIKSFKAPWIEGFYFPQDGGGIAIDRTTTPWVVRNRVYNSSGASGALITNVGTYLVCLENWIENTRRDENWRMDYAIRVYGSPTNSAYIVKNFILGGYNQPLSTKTNFKNTFIDDNYFVAGNGHSPSSPGGAKNLMVGQAADRRNEDYTAENVYIRGNTIRGKGWGVLIANVETSVVENNNFLDTYGVIEQMFSTGACIYVDRKCDPAEQNGRTAKTTIFRKNWINNSSPIHIFPRGDKPETLIVEGNTTASGRPNGIFLHRRATGDPDTPPVARPVLPSVQRVNGDASGFSAPQYID